MIACILVDIARDLLERCARALLLECAGAAVLRLRQVVPDAAVVDCSRGSQEPAIGTDIDVPLRVISEVATREDAISRWIPFPHGDNHQRKSALSIAEPVLEPTVGHKRQGRKF